MRNNGEYQNESKPELLVIHPGSDGGDTVYTILVARTGEPLASHLCSHSGFAYDDLYGARESRREEWAARFGDVSVKFLDDTDLSIDELTKRNHLWAELEKERT